MRVSLNITNYSPTQLQGEIDAIDMWNASTQPMREDAAHTISNTTHLISWLYEPLRLVFGIILLWMSLRIWFQTGVAIQRWVLFFLIAVGEIIVCVSFWKMKKAQKCAQTFLQDNPEKVYTLPQQLHRLLASHQLVSAEIKTIDENDQSPLPDQCDITLMVSDTQNQVSTANFQLPLVWHTDISSPVLSVADATVWMPFPEN